MNEYENNTSSPEQPSVQPQNEVPSSHEIPPQESAYHGTGTGRKESPYANSPYVMNHQSRPDYNGDPFRQQPHSEQQYQPQYEPPKPAKIKKSHKGLGKKILAAVLALALIAGSCGITAALVNNHWETKTSQMDTAFNQKITDLQKQIDRSTSAVPAPGHTAVSGDLMHPSQVYAANVNSVVAISSTVQSNSFYGTTEGTATGSGFILTEDGYVITNHHVVDGATSVSVITHDGSEYPASIVGTVADNDIAVLHIDAADLPAVTIGNSDNLIIGDMVVAIGNPLGELASTQTVGYVSGIDREVSTSGSITTISMIQTDAAINPGNSGGPLFNMRGEVIGITTAKYSGTTGSGASIEGIGFAIPIDDVEPLINDLIDYGYVTGAYMAVTVQDVDKESADMYGLPTGAYIVTVEKDGAAEHAGIQPKDIVIGLDDHKVTNVTELTRALRNYKAGDTATVKLIRSGKEMTLEITFDERPQQTEEPASQQQSPMPEGSYDEWFDYFRRYFGG